MCIAVVQMVPLAEVAEEARYGRLTRPARHVLRHGRDFKFPSQLVYDDKQLTCPSLQQNSALLAALTEGYTSMVHFY